MNKLTEGNYKLEILSKDGAFICIFDIKAVNKSLSFSVTRKKAGTDFDILFTLLNKNEWAKNIQDALKNMNLNEIKECIEDYLKGKEYQVNRKFGDLSVTLNLNLKTGKVTSLTDDVADNTNLKEIQQRIFQSVASIFETKTEELAKNIQEGISSGQIKEAYEKFMNASPFELHKSIQLETVLINFPVDELDANHQTQFRLRRAFWFSKISNWIQAEADATWLRKHSPDLPKEVELNLMLIIANNFSQQNMKDSAEYFYMELLKHSTRLNAETRAWVHSGYAKLQYKQKNLEKFEEYSRLAASSFFEAKDTEQAIRCLGSVAKHISLSNPDKALNLFKECLNYLKNNDASSRHVRGSIQSEIGEMLLRIHKHKEALAAINSSINDLEGILGREKDLARALSLKGLILQAMGQENSAQDYFQRAKAANSHNKDDAGQKIQEKLKNRLSDKTDPVDFASLFKEAVTIGDNERAFLVLITEYIDSQDQDFPYKLAQLEKAEIFLTQNSVYNSNIYEHILAQSFANLFDENQYFEKALAWYKKAYQLNSRDFQSRQRIGDILEDQKKFSELLNFLEQEKFKFGELPGICFMIGKTFHHMGEHSKAIEILRKLRDHEKLGESALKLINEALSAKEWNQVPQQSIPSISIQTFDHNYLNQIIADFGKYVSSNLRMNYWNKENWSSKPESLAKQHLIAYLGGKLGDTPDILEEVSTGAGRMDLYLLFPLTGQKVIIELKICGSGYSLPYAEGGIDQLHHYMENKKSGLGYLIIFDGRKRDYGKGIESHIVKNNQNIFVHFVDVRPSVFE